MSAARIVAIALIAVGNIPASTSGKRKTRNPLRRAKQLRENENAPGFRGAAIAGMRFDSRQARSTPDALATWVAMKSISGGDRQS